MTTDTCVALLDDELGVATAIDNCSSSVSIARTGVPPGFAFPIGTTTITYLATDASGNTTLGTEVVTVVADDPARQCLGPVQVWLGLKNSDDVGTKFDVRAEVFKNDTILIGSGQLNDVPGGSSGFNNAALRTISLALSGTPGVATGDKRLLPAEGHKQRPRFGSGRSHRVAEEDDRRAGEPEPER